MATKYPDLIAQVILADRDPDRIPSPHFYAVIDKFNAKVLFTTDDWNEARNYANVTRQWGDRSNFIILKQIGG